MFIPQFPLMLNSDMGRHMTKSAEREEKHWGKILEKNRWGLRELCPSLYLKSLKHKLHLHFLHQIQDSVEDFPHNTKNRSSCILLPSM